MVLAESAGQNEEQFTGGWVQTAKDKDKDDDDDDAATATAADDDDDNDDGCVNGQALFRASFPDCHTAISEGVCVYI